MRERGRWIFPLLFITIAVVVGTFVYSYLEGWRILDSLYFVIMTMTTVGYGDFVPVTNAGKIFTMVFAVVGVGSALYFFSLVGNSVFKRHVQQKVSELKSDVRKEEAVKDDIRNEVRKVRSRGKKKSGTRKK